MKAISLPLGLLVLVSLGACRKCEIPKSMVPKTPHLEASELAQAQGIYWWELTMPKDMTEKDYLVVSYVFPEGKRNPSSGGCGYKPGQKVKIFCYRDPARGNLGVSLVTPESMTGIPIEDRLKDAKIISFPIPVGQSAVPGNLLIKFSNERSVTGGNDLMPNEIGLAAFVEKHQ
jgi:hypothetical protein